MRGASVDKERSDRGLKSDLVFGDRGGRVMCELSESRENALTRSLGGADAGAFSRLPRPVYLYSDTPCHSICLFPTTCLSPHLTCFCLDSVVPEQCFPIDQSLSMGTLHLVHAAHVTFFVPIRSARCFRPTLALNTPRSRSLTA
jgi:hypothetical protein